MQDADNRAALITRFELSQTVYRKGPWAAQATDEHKHDKWSPLADLTLEAAE